MRAAPQVLQFGNIPPRVPKFTWKGALPRGSRVPAFPQGSCKTLRKPLAGDLGGTGVDVASSPRIKHHAPVTWLFARLGPTVPGKPRQGSAPGNGPIPLPSVAVRLKDAFTPLIFSCLFVCPFFGLIS